MQIYFKVTYFKMMSQRVNALQHLKLYIVIHRRITERVCGILLIQRLSNVEISPNLLHIGYACGAVGENILFYTYESSVHYHYFSKLTPLNFKSRDSWLVLRGYLLWNCIDLLRKSKGNLYYVDIHLVEL